MVWNDPNYRTVSGVFDNQDKLEDLLSDLSERGVGRDLIDVMMTEVTRDQYTGIEQSGLAKTSKVPEGASIGGLSGGVLGAIIGGLTMAGSLVIPGASLLVAGPILGVLAGGAVGAATGGLVGALVGAGIPEYEAKTYEKELEKPGNVLVVAHVLSGDVSEVQNLFKRHGGKSVLIQSDTAATTAQSGLY